MVIKAYMIQGWITLVKVAYNMITHDIGKDYPGLYIAGLNNPLSKFTGGIIPQCQTSFGRIIQGKTTHGKITQYDYQLYYTTIPDSIGKDYP